MNPRRAGSAVIVFVAVLTAIWAALYFGPQDAAAPQQQPASALRSITLLHAVVDGTHVYDGEIETPTPCHSVAAAVEVTYAEPPRGVIRITTEPQENGVCAQVITKQPFSVSFMSPVTPEVGVLVDGQPRQVAVVERQ